MEKFTTFTSKVIPLLQTNIDTDQIIPSRYLKAIDKASVIEGLFYDWRHNADGSVNEDFVLNKPGYKGRKIILAGDNFGCGSSREHAPWAITGWGIQAVISTSIGDIFKNNSLKNGLLPIVVDEGTLVSLFDLVEEVPDAELTIDLEAQCVTLPDGSSFNFEIDPFAKQCMLAGVDQLGYILSKDEEITRFEIEAGIISG